MRGWYIPAEKANENQGGKVGIIAVHGGGRDRREFLIQLGYWNANGLDVILYDSSEHGLSEGTGLGLGFGYREQFDVAGAARFAKQSLGWDRVFVIGTSVGASAALLATARESSIDAVIAENPFYDYEPFFIHIYQAILGRGSFGGRSASRYGALVNLVTTLTTYIPLDSYIENVAAFTRWWIGASGQAGPVHVVDKIAPRPLFLIHGQADEMIPISHSQHLYDQAGDPKQIWLPEQGRHADVHSIYPEEYERKVLEFINKYARTPSQQSSSPDSSSNINSPTTSTTEAA